MPKCRTVRTTAVSRSAALLFLFIFLSACTLTAAQNAAAGASPGAPSSVSGYWLCRLQLADGSFRETVFDLKQEGENVTGKASFNGTREIPLREGSYKDGKLHLVLTIGGPPANPRLATYDGTFNNGKFDVTAEQNGAHLTGTIEPTTAQAAQPPAKLPLPALHDVADNGLARTPPMGWNSWNKFAGRVDDATVRGVADAMVASGMKDAGYVYINIDDTWEAGRDAQGDITTNKKFPDMKALADYVHSKGLKIGIYSSPGPKTCAGYEGSYGHEEQDAKQYAAWGFDYLKYDWCSARRIYQDSDMQAVYQKMGEALLKAGRPIVFSLCQYGREDVWKWGAKVGGNLWRTTGDIGDRWESMSNIGFKQFAISQYQQVGHWNDPDMLEIGNGGMTADEYRTHMSLWSLLAAPLLAGNDLRNMTDETKSILMNKEVIAIDQDPAGKPVKELSDPNATAVVAVRPLQDGSIAVGLFNRGDQEQPVSVDWSKAGMGGKKLQGRDLWKHADVTLSGDSYTATVPKHGVVLLKVTAAK